MKYFKLTFTLSIFFFYNLNAQTNTICAVKYKEYKTNLGTQNYWFYQDKLISVKEPNLRVMYMRGFPVLMNNVMTTQTDTIKYNKEFNDFIAETKENSKKDSVRVSQKYYNSDVVKMTYYYDYINKNYMVVDTLQKMDNWEILNDTSTILGFKCQQAVINYKQDKYYAWFTTQLPYNAGPEGFRGLPGLILKVSNLSGIIGYEAIEIRTPFKGIVPTFNNSGEPVSSSEWLLLMKERNKKMRESMNNIINEYKKDLKQKQ